MKTNIIYTMFIGTTLMAVPLLFTTSCFAHNHLISIFETDNPQGKYILSRYYQGTKGNNVSEIIVSDTLAITLDNDTCHMVMSNAHLLQTIYYNVLPLKVPQQFVQQNAFVKTLTLDFSKNVEVIYKNKRSEISQITIDNSKHDPMNNEISDIKGGKAKSREKAVTRPANK